MTRVKAFLKAASSFLISCQIWLRQSALATLSTSYLIGMDSFEDGNSSCSRFSPFRRASFRSLLFVCVLGFFFGQGLGWLCCSARFKRDWQGIVRMIRSARMVVALLVYVLLAIFTWLSSGCLKISTGARKVLAGSLWL